MTEVLLAPPRRMSPSLLSHADTCLMRIPFHLADNTRRSSVNRAMGTGVHAGLAYYYAHRMSKLGWTLDGAMEAGVAAFRADVEDATDGFDWRYQVGGYRNKEIVYDQDEAETFVEATILNYFSAGRQWPEYRYDVLAVEYKFELPFGDSGWLRTGVIDLALLDTETGWHHLVDHKTAKKKWAKNKSQPSYSPQGAWYVDAWRELTGKNETTFYYDVISFDGEFERISAHRIDQHITATSEKAKMVARLIDQGGPFIPNPSSFLCSENYCDYWDKCPFGKALK